LFFRSFINIIIIVIIIIINIVVVVFVVVVVVVGGSGGCSCCCYSNLHKVTHYEERYESMNRRVSWQQQHH